MVDRERVSSKIDDEIKDFNPDFALDARTETKEAEAVSTQKVQVMLVAWTNFLRKKMSGILRRIPRANAKSGFKSFKLRTKPC